MDGKLKGKVAIVTGAATGIGSAIAERFGAEGAAVVIDFVHGQQDDANSVVKKITDAGGRAAAVEADITNPDQVTNLVQQTVQQFGRLDIFVNNAGIEKKMPFVDTPADVFDKIIAVNLRGPFLCSQAAARQLIKQGEGGRIINISSVHEDLPMPTNSPYCASKGGLRMLTRTICDELAPHKITVNNIAPGAVFTPIDADVEANPKLENQLMSEIPLGRWGQPSEIAGLATYLASDEAGYVTGSTYVIDGGMMRQAGSL